MYRKSVEHDMVRTKRVEGLKGHDTSRKYYVSSDFPQSLSLLETVNLLTTTERSTRAASREVQIRRAL
jgi:hypothetical protein